MLQRHDPDTFECDPPHFIFQQDNAPSHASKWTLRRLKKEGIEVLEHIGNSPDMNAIEGSISDDIVDEGDDTDLRPIPIFGGKPWNSLPMKGVCHPGRLEIQYW
jgi:hypothetical protein